MRLTSDVLFSFMCNLAQQVGGRFPMAASGGCGIVAAEVAHYLGCLEVEGVAIRLVEWPGPADDPLNLDTVRNQLASHADRLTMTRWKEAGVRFHHVEINYEIEGKTYAFESSGCRDLSAPRMPQIDYLPGALTVEEMQHLARQRKDWNKCFDREHSARNLRRLIRSAFMAFRRELDLTYPLPIGRIDRRFTKQRRLELRVRRTHFSVLKKQLRR